MLGVRCWAGFFCSCREWGLLSSCGALASRRGDNSCGAWSLECACFSSCGVWIQQLWLLGLVMWDLPGPGIETVSFALAGEFFTTGPPGKPLGSSLRASFTRTAWVALWCSGQPTSEQDRERDSHMEALYMCSLLWSNLGNHTASPHCLLEPGI